MSNITNINEDALDKLIQQEQEGINSSEQEDSNFKDESVEEGYSNDYNNEENSDEYEYEYSDDEEYYEEDSDYEYEDEYESESDDEEQVYEESDDNKLEEDLKNEILNMSFSSEDDIFNSLSTGEAFTLSAETVALEDIIGLPFFKESRMETIQGLTDSVAKIGKVLKPIDVARIVWNKDTVEEDGYEDIKYLLIDGYRRLYAATRNKHIINELSCTVWDFKNEELAKEIIPLLGFILNRNQQHYPKELWNAYTSLELSYGVTPESFEQLLQLNPGDASKMRDVMTSTHEEPRASWELREKTLEQSYTMLMKLKREENQLMKEDSSGLVELNNNEDLKTGDGTTALSDAEAREILEMNFDDMELTSDMFSKDIEEEEGMENYVHKQDVNHRERVNPKLKEEVFERDELTCQCCHEGGSYKLPELVFHHKIPVHAGGVDSMDNGVTICTNCHLQLHFFERNEKFEGGYDSIPEELKEKFRRIMQMAQIAITAGKKKFTNPKERKQQALQGITYPMPGEDMQLKRNVYARINKED